MYVCLSYRLFVSLSLDVPPCLCLYESDADYDRIRRLMQQRDADIRRQEQALATIQQAFTDSLRQQAECARQERELHRQQMEQTLKQNADLLQSILQRQSRSEPPSTARDARPVSSSMPCIQSAVCSLSNQVGTVVYACHDPILNSLLSGKHYTVIPSYDTFNSLYTP